MEPVVARRLWRRLEPLHGMIYFVPEGTEEYAAVGLSDARMGYFASRAAAMGPVPADVVIATFFNFNPDLVRRAIPDAWSLASPSDILAARLRAVDRALRRLLGDDVVVGPELTEAAELARAATAGCFVAGRPLHAAHAALPWPAQPHLVLWHAISLLREFRGDGHIAALVTEAIGPREALVLHAASGEVPKDVLRATRAWSAEQWATTEDQMRADGLVSDDGSLTPSGAQLRQRIEDATDRLAMAPWEHLGAERCDRLLSLAKPLSRMLVDNGAFPTR